MEYQQSARKVTALARQQIDEGNRYAATDCADPMLDWRLAVWRVCSVSGTGRRAAVVEHRHGHTSARGNLVDSLRQDGGTDAELSA